MNTAELSKICRQVRRDIITMTANAGSGHPGGSLSAVELMTSVFFNHMRVDPSNPHDPDRDRFVLSKGHVCPILYSALGILGYFPESVLHTLRQEGSMLQGHPSMVKCPGIDISTGSLGQGAACAVGMALAGKRDGKDYRVFTMVGDGEIDEGIVWEAMMCANKYKLDNYIMLFDNNGLQLDGTTDQIMPGLDMSKKAADFGFDVYEIDGHDMEQILDTFDKIRAAKNGKPKFINAHTVKGKGVYYMENSLDWHGKAPNKEQYESAMEQLERGI